MNKIAKIAMIISVFSIVYGLIPYLFPEYEGFAIYFCLTGMILSSCYAMR